MGGGEGVLYDEGILLIPANEEFFIECGFRPIAVEAGRVDNGFLVFWTEYISRQLVTDSRAVFVTRVTDKGFFVKCPSSVYIQYRAIGGKEKHHAEGGPFSTIGKGSETNLYIECGFNPRFIGVYTSGGNPQMDCCFRPGKNILATHIDFNGRTGGLSVRRPTEAYAVLKTDENGFYQNAYSQLAYKYYIALA